MADKYINEFTELSGTPGGTLVLPIMDTDTKHITVTNLMAAGLQLGGVMATSPSTDYITKFVSATNVGNSLLYDNGTNIGVGYASPTARLDILGTTETDEPTYSAEFLDADNWTAGAGWTGDFAAGFAHSSGTATLTHDHAAVATTKYQISYTVTGRTAGSFAVAFGGLSLDAISATGAFGPTATNTDPLTITPTTDFNGTIVISIKSITAASTPILSIRDSAGNVVNEIRSGTSNTNSAIGANALQTNTTGTHNSAIGVGALQNNTTGTRNSAIGTNALQTNTTGINNSAIGAYALISNTTGGYNIAIGVYALITNTTGTRNIAIGTNALQYNTTGTRNSAIGANAGLSLTTGASNTFIGYGAGYNASQKVDVVNSMALGNGAYTTADNQVVIGNTSITSTVLHGDITLDDGGDIVLGTTTGTKIGTATSQKLGFFNATPVVQRSHIANATDATSVIARLNDLYLHLSR